MARFDRSCAAAMEMGGMKMGLHEAIFPGADMGGRSAGDAVVLWSAVLMRRSSARMPTMPGSATTFWSPIRRLRNANSPSTPAWTSSPASGCPSTRLRRSVPRTRLLRHQEQIAIPLGRSRTTRGRRSLGLFPWLPDPARRAHPGARQLAPQTDRDAAPGQSRDPCCRLRDSPA